MNRGLARRTVFEDRQSVRTFQAYLARVVRSGDLEVHAFVLMTTHFHLLVRSPNGKLSSAMQRIQNGFVRWFNRRARRDGPLFRARFLSIPVKTLRYRKALVRYIDQNPIMAGLVKVPERYPYGSAGLYAKTSGPIWLNRTWVEAEAKLLSGESSYSLASYRTAFGDRLSAAKYELIEARFRSPSSAPDPLTDLVGAAPEEVKKWMRRKAALADGTRPGLPCATVESILLACDSEIVKRPDWRLARGEVTIEVWPALRVALLRDLGGLSWAQISAVIALGETAARRRYSNHRFWVESDAEYRSVLASATSQCLEGW